MLEFDKLIEWIYAPDDEFRERRAGAVAAREKLVQIIRSGEMNYKSIQEILDLRYQKEVWENVGRRIVANGWRDRTMISVG